MTIYSNYRCCVYYAAAPTVSGIGVSRPYKRVRRLLHHMRSCSLTDDRTFLKFFLNYATAHEVETVVGWGHPDLIHLMKYGPCHMLLDCTLSCVPKGFKQLLIIMIYTAATGMHALMYVIYAHLNVRFMLVTVFLLMSVPYRNVRASLLRIAPKQERVHLPVCPSGLYLSE